MSKFKLSAFLLSFILASNAFAGSVIKTIQAGAADQTVVLKIIDSADGTPETDVVFNTSGIDLEYWRHGANTATDITEATQTVSGAHADGGFVHIGHGMYRLDLPDAAVAAGATAVEVYGTVTGMIVIGGTVQLNTSGASPFLADDTAQSGTGSTIVLASSEGFANDILNGSTICLDSGTGAGQCRIITDYVGASDTATITPDWTTNPSSDSTYYVIAGTINVAAWMGAPVTTPLQTAEDFVDEWETQSQADPTGFHVNVLEVGGTTQTANDNGADINAILVDTGTTLQGEVDGIQADTENIQSRIPTALVNGRIDASVDATGFESGAETDVQTAAAAALTAYDPPTNTELNSAISGLENLSQAEVQTAAVAALTAYDPPTNTEMEARTLPAANYFDFTTDEVDVGLLNGCTITGDGGASPFDVSCP